MRVEEECLRSSINTLSNNLILLKSTRTICASTQPLFLWKNGIQDPEMTKDLQELVAKKLHKKLILKSSLKLRLVTGSKIPCMQHIEYTMKSERSIETQWFRSSTYTTSMSLLSGHLTKVIGPQVVMNST